MLVLNNSASAITNDIRRFAAINTPHHMDPIDSNPVTIEIPIIIENST